MLGKGNYLQRHLSGETTVYSGQHTKHVCRFLEYGLCERLRPEIGFRVRCVNGDVKVVCEEPYKNEVITAAKQILMEKMKKQQSKLRYEFEQPLSVDHN